MEEVIVGMNMSVQSADFIAKEARANTALTAVQEWKEQIMTTYDLAVALAKRWKEEGYTYEDLLQTFDEAVAEARQEIARMKGADDE